MPIAAPIALTVPLGTCNASRCATEPDGILIPNEAAFGAYLAACALAVYLAVQTDRALKVICAPLPIRVASVGSYAAFLGLPLFVTVVGFGASLVATPGVLLLFWAYRVGRGSGPRGRRVAMLLAYQRLYGLLGVPPSEARTEAALRYLRGLDRLRGSPDDAPARLLQFSFIQQLVERSISEAELSAQVDEVNGLIEGLEKC
jgi:hypothetical protein